MPHHGCGTPDRAPIRAPLFQPDLHVLPAFPTCRPERIRPIAERFGLESDAVLDNIVCARAHTWEQQFGERV